MRCANCDAEVTGAYCSACGQRADVRRVAFGHLLARVGGELTSFEQPLLRTLRGVLTRPGKVADDYVRGRRIRYTNPVKWALLSTALAFFVGQLVGARGPVRIEASGELDPDGWAASVARFLESNTAPLFVLGMLPALALAMRLCFARTGRSVAEELVLVLYTYGCAALLQVVLAALAPLGVPPGVGGSLPLIWTAWGAVAFHPTRRAWISVLLVLLAHLLWILGLGAIVLLVFALRGF